MTDKSLVKVKYVDAAGNPTGRDYTYFTEEPLALGTRVRVPIKDGRTLEAVVTVVDVPDLEILAYPDKVKTIPAGSIMVQPAPDIEEPTVPAEAAIPATPTLEGVQELLNAAEPAPAEGPLVVLETQLGPRPDLKTAYLEALKLKEYADRRLVQSNADLKPAVEDLAIIAKGKKAILEIKKTALFPLKSRIDIITDAFAKILEPLEYADQVNRRKVESFNNEQKRKAAEAAAIQAEKEALAAREAKLSGTGEISVDLTPPQAPPPVPAHTRTDQATQGFAKVTKWEIVDLAAIPREYMVPDTAKITKMVKASQGSIAIPGIRIWTDEAVRINTK